MAEKYSLKHNPPIPAFFFNPVCYEFALDK